MIQEIIDDILEELGTVSGALTVEEWVGDIEDVIKNPARLPALYAAYQGAKFGEKRVIGSNEADAMMDFIVIIVARNLKSDTESPATCYAMIEAVRTKLNGHVIGNYGYLWPTSEDLLLSEKRILCYGLAYKLETKV
jgi:hypothetical protein